MVAVRNRFETARLGISLGDGPAPVVFQHAAFCVTALPTEPLDRRDWADRVGTTSVSIDAGKEIDPASRSGWREFPIPYGRWPRLILMHLCTEAMLTGKAEVSTMENLTAFVTSLGVPPNGRLRNDAREQMAALAVSTVRIWTADSTSPSGLGKCDLWAKLDPEDRARWVRDWSTLKLSDEFVRSLRLHAVPMDRRAVKAVMHAPAALDVLAWVEYAQSVGIQGVTPWSDLHRRFGRNYKLLRQFRFAFRRDLTTVQKLCPHIRIDSGDAGVSVTRVRRASIPHHEPVQMALPI